MGRGLQYIQLKTAVPGPKSQDILARMAEVVTSALAPSLPIVAEHAEGSLLRDVDGNTFIDLTGGLGVLNIGHRHQSVNQAIHRQLEQLAHTSFAAVPYELYISLAERLTALYPGRGSAQAMFFNSGAEAVENSIKIARAVTGRPAIIAFERAFHGRTLMALTLTGKSRPYKVGMGPRAPEVYRVPFPYSYQCRYAKSQPHTCDSSCYAAIEESIRLQVDPEEIAAVILEPILGEGGFIVPPPDFLPWLREWTTRHGALLVVDEIQTGFGRTGRMFSVEHFGVRPDLVVAGKSIADGLPLSTVMGDREIMGHLPSGLLGGTYGGNPLALAAAHAVLDTIEKEDLLSRAVGQGKELKARLLSMQNRVAQIGDVRGIGAMVGVEFVTDRESRGPNSPFLQRVIRRALENGVLLLKAGQYGHVLRFLAPLNTPVDMLDEAMDVLEETLTVSAIRA